MDFDDVVYDDSYETFMKYNIDHPIVSKWLHSFCAGAGIHEDCAMLDVGAGSGVFLAQLLAQPMHFRPKLYCGIEPLESHFHSLSNTIVKLGMESISHLYMKEVQDFLVSLPHLPISGQKFDLILLSHSIYYISQRSSALLRLQQLLTPRGKIAVVLNSSGFMPDLWARFDAFLPCRNLTDDNHSVTSRLIAREAQAAGIPAIEYTLVDTGFDISDLFQDGHESERDLFMTFVCNTTYSCLPAEIRDQLWRFTCSYSTCCESRTLLQVPTGVVVLQHSDYNVPFFNSSSDYISYFNAKWDARRRCGGSVTVPFEGFDLVVHPNVFSPYVIETYSTSVIWDAVRSYGVTGKTVADVGSGCGVLSVLAAKHGATAVHAYEIDADAARNASQNVTLHSIGNIVNVWQRDFFDNSTSDVTFDIIMINLPLHGDAWKNASAASTCIGSALDAILQVVRRRLNPGGRAIVVRASFEGTSTPRAALGERSCTIMHAFGQSFWVEAFSDHDLSPFPLPNSRACATRTGRHNLLARQCIHLPHLAQLLHRTCVDMSLQKGFNILDVGAGTGVLLEMMLRYPDQPVPGSFLSIEPSSDMRDQLSGVLARTGLQSCAESMEFVDFDLLMGRTFDLILFALSTKEDIGNAMRVMHTFLKRDGRMLMIVDDESAALRNAAAKACTSNDMLQILAMQHAHFEDHAISNSGYDFSDVPKDEVSLVMSSMCIHAETPLSMLPSSFLQDECDPEGIWHSETHIISVGGGLGRGTPWAPPSQGIQPPLSDEQYAIAYKTFLASRAGSHEAYLECVMKAFVQCIVPGGRYSLMDVGAGFGEPIRHVATAKSELLPAYILGIEPNPQYASRLRALYAELDLHDSNVHCASFSSTYVVPEGSQATATGKFDVIFAGHCAYYFQDKQASLQHLKGLLAPNGKAIFALQGDGPFPRMFKAFSSSTTSDVYAYTDKDLRRDLQAAGWQVFHHLTYLEELDHSAFFNDDSAHDFFNFMLNFDTRCLEPGAWADILNHWQRMCYHADGRILYREPASIFVVG